MLIWIKLEENNVISDSKIIYGQTDYSESGFNTYDLSINDLNSIVFHKSRLVMKDNKYRIDNSMPYTDEYLLELERENQRKKDIEEANAELDSLYLWFGKYDIQVSQYLRNTRLGINESIHIDEILYNSIDELDNKAREYQNRIRELKKIIES